MNQNENIASQHETVYYLGTGDPNNRDVMLKVCRGKVTDVSEDNLVILAGETNVFFKSELFSSYANARAELIRQYTKRKEQAAHAMCAGRMNLERAQAEYSNTQGWLSRAEESPEQEPADAARN